MMKTLTAAVFAGAMASTAGAATFDFVAEAFGAERGVANGTELFFDGVGVTFNATDGGNEAFAYFDDLSSNLPAGLGVCAELTSTAQCVLGGDDNLRANEVLTLTFDQTLATLTGFTFNDKNHNPLPATSPTATLLWAVNGGTFQSISFADAVSASLSGVNSISFAHEGTDYYISAMAAVPLPAGMLLLGTALGGLGLARRKTKAA